MVSYSVQVGFLAGTDGVDVIAANFERLDVQRLADVTEELQYFI